MRYQIGGFSNVLSAVGKNNFTSVTTTQIGRVYGVVTTENTPTKAMFEKVGGFDAIGTVFYLDYEQSKNTTGEINDTFLDTCKIAKPFYPQSQYYPVLNELIVLQTLTSPATQISPSSAETYYQVLNLWNNTQQNSQPASDDDFLGTTFFENPNTRPLISYQGDHIISGRQGNALRFSTTTRLRINSNEWSDIGNDNDPITILTNGLAYDPNKNYYVEQINKDASSIYLTSAQKIPLQTDKTGILNPLTNPLNVPDYFSSQIILNGDRIVLNSKKNEVMLFAKTNIELNTKNIINLNANERVHLNTSLVFLGTINDQLPNQPVLLGYETSRVFEHLQETLTRLASYLSSAFGSAEGAPMLGLNSAGEDLLGDMKKMCDLLENITSKRVFTA